MGLGVRSGRSYTVNNQLTCGWLMARADEVYEPGFGPGDPAILVTGNDFSGVHGPLLRSGRARVFDYAPTPEETADVLAPAFEAHVDGPPSALVEAFPEATVAELLEAVSRLRDGWLESAGIGTYLPATDGAVASLPEPPRIALGEIAAFITARRGSGR